MVEPALEIPRDGIVVSRPHVQPAPRGRAAQLPFLHHQHAVLEYVARRGEHLRNIRIAPVNRDIHYRRPFRDASCARARAATQGARVTVAISPGVYSRAMPPASAVLASSFSLISLRHSSRYGRSMSSRMSSGELMNARPFG